MYIPKHLYTKTITSAENLSYIIDYVRLYVFETLATWPLFIILQPFYMSDVNLECKITILTYTVSAGHMQIGTTFFSI